MAIGIIKLGYRAWSTAKKSKIKTNGTGRSRWFSKLFWGTEAILISEDVWNELDDNPANDPDFWDVMTHLVTVGLMVPGISRKLVGAKDISKSAALAAFAHLPKLKGLRTHVADMAKGRNSKFGKYVVTLFKGKSEIIATNKYGDKILGITKSGVKTYKNSSTGRKVAFVGGTSIGAALLVDALDGDLDSLNVISAWLESMASIMDPDGNVEVVADTIRDAFYAISDPDFRRSQIQLENPTMDATECQLEMMKGVAKALDYAREAMNVEASPDGAIIEDDADVQEADENTAAPIAVSKGEVNNDNGSDLSTSSKTSIAGPYTTPNL
jgi:hypothetical protein